MEMQAFDHGIKTRALLSEVGISLPDEFKRILNVKDPFSEIDDLLSFAVFLDSQDVEYPAANRVINALLSFDSYENVFDRIVDAKSQHQYGTELAERVAKKLYPIIGTNYQGEALTEDEFSEKMESYILNGGWRLITDFIETPIEEANVLLCALKEGESENGTPEQVFGKVESLVRQYLSRVKVSERWEDDSEAISYEDLMSPGKISRTHTTTPLYSSTNYTLLEIRDSMNELRSTGDLLECKEAFSNLNEDIEKYGAKGAYLLALIRSLPYLKARFEECSIEVVIPPFALLSTETYSAWKSGQGIDEQLKEIFLQFEGEPIIVRSSAVYSEDNENSTGAGIYESVVVQSPTTFEDFKDAVIRVYESVDSEKAIAYRKEVGVADEKMGIVVQKFIEPDNDQDKGSGYLNTIRPGRSDLMDVVLPSGARSVLKKQNLANLLVNNGITPSNEKQSQYFAHKIDSRVIDVEKTLKLTLLGHIYERVTGMPLQMEYASDFDAIYLLQVRPLPKSFSEDSNVVFPEDLEPLYESAALGCGDFSLDILNPHEDNRDKTGVVIFDKSFMATESLSSQAIPLDNRIPQHGAVIICEASYDGHGHLETLALQRGVLLVFNDDVALFEHDLSTKAYMAQFGLFPQKAESPFTGLDRVRVVSDGKDAKVYEIQ